MFITAKTALIDSGASGRWMPFDVTVEFETREGWLPEVKGRSVDYLAECYNDLRSLGRHARLVNSATGDVIFYG